MAANGALNTAAMAAATPPAQYKRRFCFGTPSHPAPEDITDAPICATGPSGPMLTPPPNVTADAKNFTTPVLARINPKSLQNANFVGKIPPPPVSLANTRTNNAATKLTVTTLTNVPAKNNHIPCVRSATIVQRCKNSTHV